MNADELQDLKIRAQSGDVSAMFSLGSLVVSGVDAGMPPRQGVYLLTDAAQRGEAAAAHLLAVLSAAGRFGLPNWPQALDHLARAAELGSAYAAQQLVLLAGPQPVAVRGWRALRNCIDVQAWRTPPAKEVVCEAPRIRKANGFLPAAACDWLIWRATARLEPAQQRADSADPAGLHEMRTSSEAEFSLLDTDLVMLLTQERIAAITGVPREVMEPPRVLQYRAGEEFALHHDFLDPQDPALKDELQRNGQRIVSFLLYLNDDYEGGETDFPVARLRHKGRKGDALYFANITDGDVPDHRTLHAGLPPTRGAKWLLSQWMRSRTPARI
ncbi:MAG TPA: 2OG-Fe(II) oxygenase [Nevskiaceae bacterium]|nr:2OG-Fe(II) oxygenase [Nevskiaceae bacterium]